MGEYIPPFLKLLNVRNDPSSFFFPFFFRTNHPIPPFFVFSTRKINVDDDDDIMGYNATRPIFHWIMGVVMGE